MMSLMAAEIRSCAVKGGVLESAIHYINRHILELPNQITVVLGHEIQTSEFRPVMFNLLGISESFVNK